MKKLFLYLLLIISATSFAQDDSASVDEVKIEPILSQEQKQTTLIYDTQKLTIYDTIRVIETPIKNKEKFESKSTPTAMDNIESAKPDLSTIFSSSKIFWSLIVCILGYFILKLLVIIVERFAERSTYHRITLKSISPIIRIVGWVLVLSLIHI